MEMRKKQQKPGGIPEHGMCRTHDTQRFNCQIKWIKLCSLNTENNGETWAQHFAG